MIDDFRNRRLLLIESHEGLRFDLTRSLGQAGFRVDAFASAVEALAVDGAPAFAVQIVDVASPGAIEWLRRRGSVDETIVLASHSAHSELLGKELSSVLDGMELLYKPFSIHTLETRVLTRLVASDTPGAEGILDPILETREPELISILARARRLARRELPIVIEGELGSGRRALAEAIAGWSTRVGSPVVAVERAELEAVGRAGLRDRVEELISDGRDGTMVVVDPMDWPEHIQVEWVAGMRRFDEKGPRWLTIARQSLDQGVREGRFLLELQYRLDAARVVMPSFRNRRLDQVDLCRAIARRVAREMGERAPEMDRELVDLLSRDGFPGNRLGLESRLRSCMARGGSDPQRMVHLLSEDSEGHPSQDQPRPLASLHLKTLERDTIIRALAHWEGNRTRASLALGISVRTLRNKIREYGLR